MLTLQSFLIEQYGTLFKRLSEILFIKTKYSIQCFANFKINTIPPFLDFLIKNTITKFQLKGFDNEYRIYVDIMTGKKMSSI